MGNVGAMAADASQHVMALSYCRAAYQKLPRGVGRFGAGFVVLFHRILQHQYFFDAVGEAVRMVILFGLFCNIRAP